MDGWTNSHPDETDHQACTDDSDVVCMLTIVMEVSPGMFVYRTTAESGG